MRVCVMCSRRSSGTINRHQHPLMSVYDVPTFGCQPWVWMRFRGADAKRARGTLLSFDCVHRSVGYFKYFPLVLHAFFRIFFRVRYCCILNYLSAASTLLFPTDSFALFARLCACLCAAVGFYICAMNSIAFISKCEFTIEQCIAYDSSTICGVLWLGGVRTLQYHIPGILHSNRSHARTKKKEMPFFHLRRSECMSGVNVCIAQNIQFIIILYWFVCCTQFFALFFVWRKIGMLYK